MVLTQLHRLLTPMGAVRKIPQIYQVNQLLGAELIVNGDFSLWSGDNPSSWTITGESGSNPAVTERDPGQVNANSKTVGGAANFFSTTNSQPRISQAVMSIDSLYQVDMNLTARVSGNLGINPGFYSGNNNFSTVGNIRLIRRANSATFQITVGTQPTDLTLDDVSIKKITPSSVITVPSDCTIDYFFEPTNPNKEEQIILQYRMPNSGDELLNGFLLFLLRRNTTASWSVLRRSITAGVLGTLTNMLNDDSGTTTGLRVVLSGNTHTIYRWVGSALTQLDSFTDATYNTAVLANAIYPSDVINNQLVVS